VGVEALGLPTMRFEIRVTAIIHLAYCHRSVLIDRVLTQSGHPTLACERPLCADSVEKVGLRCVPARSRISPADASPVMPG